MADTGGAWFALAAGQLHVGVAEPFVPARKAHPALRVAGGVAALERLAATLWDAGASVTWDQRLPEVRRFFTADPGGNRLELLTPADPPTPP